MRSRFLFNSSDQYKSCATKPAAQLINAEDTQPDAYKAYVKETLETKKAPHTAGLWLFHGLPFGTTVNNGGEGGI